LYGKQSSKMSTAVNTFAVPNPVKNNNESSSKSKPADDFFYAIVQPSKLSTDDNQQEIDGEESDDIEIEELKEEVQDLVDDQVYNDFVTAIAKDKPLNVTEEGGKDEEFVPIDAVTADTKDANEKDECGSDVSNSEESDGLSGEEDLEDSNIASEELKLLQNEVPVAIPKDSLMAKQERYPFFWRYKHSVRNVENEDYKSDEDPEFIPENVNDAEPEVAINGEHANKVHEKNDTESGSSASDSDGEDLNEVMEEGNKLKEEMHDVQEDVKGLIDMVEEMSTVHGSSNLAQSGKEAKGEDKVDTESSEEDESATNCVDRLDDSNYNEAEDLDYKPEEDFFYAVVQKNEDLSDISSSSEDESDMME